MKRTSLTIMAVIMLSNFVLSQNIIDNETLIGSENLYSDVLEQVLDEKLILDNSIYPIDIELVRTLEQVLDTGEGGFLILNQNDLFVKGQVDASRYYQGYKGAGTGTLITSLISPLVGLIPAIATSSTAPKEENLGYPDPELFGQKEYYDSYTQKAKKIKQGKVWTNWAIGLGVNIIAVLILL